MTPTPTRKTVTLLIDDQGAALYRASGELLGWLPQGPPGPERRGLWVAALREWVPAGTEFQLLLGHSGLQLQCQEAPFLSVAERREVAQRSFPAENGEPSLTTAAALDEDPAADGGHVLWMAGQPSGELRDWLEAIQGAGCVPTFVSPFQRALVRGLDSLWDLPVDRVVLAMDPGRVGHLCIFRGRFLSLQRTFLLPPDLEEAEELIVEEVSRLLQFFKQKNRLMAFRAIWILGLPELSEAFRNRMTTTLLLEPSFLAPDLWPVLLEGLEKERVRKDGLNLLPQELQEARERKVLRNLVWGAFLGLGSLLILASLFLVSQETIMAREVTRAENLLAAREARRGDDEQVIQARLPLLRVRLAETRQRQAVTRLGALSLTLFTVPQGIQLEKVEILEAPGEPLAHTFEVTGLAFTEQAFSMGPLAQYLLALGRQPGLTVQPLTEVSISDRVKAGGVARLDQQAITRFTLKGRAQ